MPLDNITRTCLTLQDKHYPQYLLCLKCQQLNTTNIPFLPLTHQHFLRYYHCLGWSMHCPAWVPTESSKFRACAEVASSNNATRPHG